MKKGKLFITALAVASIMEHIINFIRKCLRGFLGLVYFSYRFIVFVAMTIYINVKILLLWIFYYSVAALMIFVQIFSLPVTFVVMMFALLSYAKQRNINLIEAVIDAKGENGLNGFVDFRKVSILCFIISALLYFVIYQLFFL